MNEILKPLGNGFFAEQDGMVQEQEPLEEIKDIGASAEKIHGILGISKKSEDLKKEIKEQGTQYAYCYGIDCDEDRCRCHDDCSDDKHTCI